MDDKTDLEDESSLVIEVHYRDDELIVVEKPSGMLVHPYKSRSAQRKNLMKVVRDQIGQYVYPVHRLDRPVSGPVIFGLNGKVVRSIKERWHHDETIKEYVTLCLGHITDSGKFDFSLKGPRGDRQDALTEYWPLENFNQDFTLLKVRIHTGRKHQIRRHFCRTRYNIVGDTTYGKGVENNYFKDELGLERIFLHCSRLQLVHPIKNEKISVKSPLPKNLKDVLIKMNCSSQTIQMLCEKSFEV